MAVFNINSAGALIGRCNGIENFSRLQSGDKVVFGPGVIDCGNRTLRPPHGVQFIGPGSAELTVKAQIDSRLAGQVAPQLWRGLTLDVTGLDSIGDYGPVELADGRFELDDVVVTGVAGNANKNGLTFVGNLASVLGLMTNCRVYGVGNDCLSVKAPGTGKGRLSRVDAIDCELDHCGSNSTDQLATTHEGAQLVLQRCHLHHHGYANKGAMAVYAATPAASWIDMFHCLVDQNAGYVAVRNIEDCTIMISAVAKSKGIDMDVHGGIARRNKIICSSLDGEHGIQLNAKNITLEGNYIYGVKDATYGEGILATANALGRHVIFGNVIENCRRGCDIREAAGAAYIVYSNRMLSVVQYEMLTAAEGVTYTSGYNYLPGGAEKQFNYSLDSTDWSSEA